MSMLLVMIINKYKLIIMCLRWFLVSIFIYFLKIFWLENFKNVLKFILENEW